MCSVLKLFELNYIQVYDFLSCFIFGYESLMFQCDSHNRNSEHRVMSGINTRSQDVWLAVVMDENNVCHLHLLSRVCLTKYLCAKEEE